nr:putative transposase (putative), gypsy type [Tanacetum cinerariifolium]
MSFSKRFDNAAVCYTKPLDSLKNWNNRFFWVDDFACLASFSWQTATDVIRDPAPVTDDFNAQDYATFVAHPSPFRKFPEAFLCLVGLSHHYTLDEETYPQFVHKDGEDMDLFAFIHAPDPTKVRVVEQERDEGNPLLLETTVAHTIPLLPIAPDRGGQDANIQPVIEVADTIVEDAAPMQSRRQRKRKYVVVDAGWLPTLLKSWGRIMEHLVGVAAIPTLLFVTASVSTTPEHEDRDHTYSVAELNLCTIGAPRRFVISSDSSHHSGTNVAEAEVDSLIRYSALIMTSVTVTTPIVYPTSVTKEKVVEPSLFGVGSSSAGGTDPGVFLDLTEIHRMKHDQLFIEFNVGAARQMSLSAKVRMRAEYNVKEKRKLKSMVEVRDESNALRECNVILEKERDALDVKEKVTVYDNYMEQLEKFQDDWMKIVEDKFDKIYTDFVEMALHLEEQFYPHLLTTISGRMWLLTHGIELAIAKCLNSLEYLSALGTAIGKAIEKGMQDGLATRITHGKEDRVLTDDASVEAIMEIIHLEDPVAEKLGLNELQPNVDQLMIRENIMNHKSVLRDVFVSLSVPFSTSALTGVEGTSGTVPTTATTTALSTTLASTSTVNHIFIDNYEFVDADDQAVAGRDDASFPNVDDAELHIFK